MSRAQPANVTQNFNLDLRGTNLLGKMDADQWYRDVFLPTAKKAKSLGLTV